MIPWDRKQPGLSWAVLSLHIVRPGGHYLHSLGGWEGLEYPRIFIHKTGTLGLLATFLSPHGLFSLTGLEHRLLTTGQLDSQGEKMKMTDFLEAMCRNFRASCPTS